MKPKNNDPFYIFAFIMTKHILTYSLLAFSLLMLFQLSSIWSFNYTRSTEWIIILVAIVSLVMGVFLARGKKSGNTEIDTPDLRSYDELGITEREYEVLCMIDQGLSNKEVAEKLFISQNTVKTHLSNLYVKLDAKRRTQALKNAKDLKIII